MSGRLREIGMLKGFGGRICAAADRLPLGADPIPAVHYVDDVTISLGRMPYAP